MKVKLLVLLLLPVIFVYSMPDSNSPSQLLDQYTEGVKGASVKLLESSIDDKSVIIVKNNIIDKTNNYDKNEFISLIQKKIIGNWKSDSQVSSLYEDGNHAAFKMENLNGKIQYQSYVTCLKSGENWKIVSLVIDINKVSE
ncbi:MAG: nuclear transport factor 2 family protein [Ignavibacteriaceae bacterium]